MFSVSDGEIECGDCKNDASWFGFGSLADDLSVLPDGEPGESGLMFCGRCGAVGALWGVQTGPVPVFIVLTAIPARDT